MRNHDQKSRDMSRSVLASTSRVAARKRKQAAAQRARAANADRMRRLLRFTDDPDAFDEPLTHRIADLPDPGEQGMVAMRRTYDKLSPLLRWGAVTVERDPRLRGATPSDRHVHFARLLGDTLAGRHGLQHLGYVLGHPNPHDGWATFVARHFPPSTPVDRPAQVRAALDVVIGNGAVGDLNRAIKASTARKTVECPDCRRRHAARPFPYCGDPDVFVAGEQRTHHCGCGGELHDPGPQIAHRIVVRVHRST